MKRGGPTIYHTGDTDVFEDMKLIPMSQKLDLMLASIGGHFGMDSPRAALAKRNIADGLMVMKPGDDRLF